MHVLFVNPGFPAQFGPLAQYLATQPGWRVTYVTAADLRNLDLAFQHLTYRVPSRLLPAGCPNHGNLHVLFEHMQAVYTALKQSPQVQPNVVVGHAFYGTMLHLRNLYPDCPFVAYFDWLPPPFWSPEFAFRPEFPPLEGTRLLHATVHTFKNLQLLNADAAYTPTEFQRSTAPAELQGKLRVIFDGVDASLFRRQNLPRPFVFRGVTITPETRVVTYASPGLESVRGFDVFLKVAKRVAERMPNVVFLIAGEAKTQYGHEEAHLRGQSFKDYVLAQDRYPLDRLHFLGKLSIPELITLFSLTDLHLYLTVPFVLSWSVFEAMAAECTILASRTAPVQEVIDDEVHGLLSDFGDVEDLASKALDVLREPTRYRSLGAAARHRVLERYDIESCGRQMADFLTEVAIRHSSANQGGSHASGCSEIRPPVG